ncbi:lipopolysaccharide kinase InaA family protein [Marinimicrobium sp. ABcell2]|uniref:lipopolysaccharide kinase InaA family protein n=1 Tax=Marinimicrobium sp. ABcell2 TaxID=3069751 RepID=UPI0027B38255|nr:lipopolysaccharide kinase InaA family protein [Marinimicrobium sp. ABcell2]MDQ2075504.1 lipopolysaccharide kinase InaA family protein [Marinimicrobium sp. ABcell2]
MDYTPPTPAPLGRFRAMVAQPYQQPEFLQQLEQVEALLAGPEVEKISEGADAVYRVRLNYQGQTLDVAVKRFARQSLLKDWYDHAITSKAERSFVAADYLLAHGVATPQPVAFLDCWQGKRLVESYYLSVFQPADSFREHLSDVLWNVRDNDAIMPLLETLAPAVRAMHDAGFAHQDMGNQNILMPKNADGTLAQPQFIDLNRGRVYPSVTNRQRAFDISRLMLPGEYLKFFLFIYCHHQDVPPELARWERRYRRRFARHQRTRRWRHPLRSLKQWLTGQVPKHQRFYPPLRDLWVWDEKSAQAMIVLSKAEKNRVRSKTHTLSMFWRTLCAAPAVYRRYTQLMRQSFSQPVELDGRIGVALHPHLDYIPAELELLDELGNPPVLLRFCHHESEQLWDGTIDLINQLHSRGVSIMVAFVQDRQALLEPDSWRALLEKVIPQIADKVDDIEIGHAINRVKWGLWRARDYVALLEPALALQARFPGIRLTGPACIDFEYAYVVSALQVLPAQAQLAALSHHLYVDRRGHPENPQGRFSTLEKCALLRAIAQWSPRTEDRVIVSEVNWPVKGTSVWSPVGAGYESPEGRRNPPGVDEDEYADYMLRYYTLALCSGHVDRVYWWRLSAHGYGLVDDRDNWRRRPAFTALGFLLRTLEGATFIARHEANDSVYLMEFARGNTRILMAWTTEDHCEYWPSFEHDQVLDSMGQVSERRQLSGSPLYLVRSGEV